MFQNFNTQVVGFPSQAQQKKQHQENGCQTDGKKITDSEVQVKESRAVETQATATSQDRINYQYNQEDLARFLQSAQVILERELKLSVSWDKSLGQEEDGKIEKIHQFLTPLKSEKRVSSIGWSKTGGTLAVGFCEDRYESCVAIYKVTNRPSAPRILATSSSVTSLLFHPDKPSILLIGLMSGEVMVWYLSHDAADGELTSIEKCREHRGQVMHVGWSNDNIISTGTDGCLIMRKYCNETRTITTLLRYKLTAEYVGRKVDDNQDNGIEITAFSGMDQEECVVGVAGGGLLQCRLSIQQQHRSPVTYIYEPHTSFVTAIKYAPTAAIKMFAAASADGHIRIFKFNEAEPKWILRGQECVIDVYWTGDVSTMGICGGDNTVRFVQIQSGKETSTQIALRGQQIVVKAEPSPNRTMVAVGTTSGTVEVWRTVL